MGGSAFCRHAVVLRTEPYGLGLTASIVAAEVYRCPTRCAAHSAVKESMRSPSSWVFICDECVDVAYEAMYGEKPPKRQHQKPDKDKRKNT